METNNQLVQIVKESGLEQTKAQVLLNNFQNYFEIAAEWELKINSLNVTDISQKAEMKMAGEARKFLKQKRIDVENTRKSLKEQSLREGQTIDSIAKILKNLIEPLEDKAESIEKFAEIQENLRKDELKRQREKELESYIEFVPVYADLRNMTEEDYQKLYNGAKLQLEAKIREAERIERERIAKEKAEAEERERIRKENERLKKEAEIKEKQLQAERAKAEAERKKAEEIARKEREEAERKLKAEQEAARLAAEKAAQEKAKLEAELRAKAEAELQTKKEKEEAERKAKSAPDKEKLLSLITSLKNTAIPETTTENAAKITKNVKDMIDKICIYIHSNLDNL